MNYFKISTNYQATPGDFQIGNETVSETFKEFEHTRIDLFSVEGVNKGYIILAFLISEHFPHPFVRFVWIDPAFRGKKASLDLYLKANEFCVYSYGLPLASDNLRWVKSSAQAIWVVLVDKGLATKTNNYFQFC